MRSGVKWLFSMVISTVTVPGPRTSPDPGWSAALVLAALVVGGVVTGLGYAVAADQPGSGEVLGPGTVTVEITIENSHFTPDRIRVREGTQVRFVVHNTDPIGHELVVGPEEIHLRHANGTEAAHPPVPGEVSLGPLETGATVYEVDSPESVRMVCHLPRHEAYGMSGTIEVVG